jgi:hypothetical protein
MTGGWVELGTVAFGAVTTIATIIRLWMTGTKSSWAKTHRQDMAEKRQIRKERDLYSKELQEARLHLALCQAREQSR